MLSRRTLLAGSALWAGLQGHHASAEPAPGLDGQLAELERQSGGTIGVAILDAGSGTVAGHRLDAAFPLCSTHKILSAAYVLARAESGKDRLDRRIAYGPEAVLSYAPVTKQHVGAGMTLDALCAAAVTVSDNTGANLLLASFGGPEALTAYLRSLGDPVTRLDRTEPTLNEAKPGDPRDTTTPRAMAALVRTIVLGPALSEASRTRLQGWMVGCQTGLRKIRAGVPADWRAGDKTGSGERHASNDVAVLWRPGRSPLVVAAYTIDTAGDDASRDALFAA
ncbi:MAG: class A beta-lactamase, partial [Caulobacteraceae bacterium]|nr:class A beta-lactamase [Caulobacter sp.]